MRTVLGIDVDDDLLALWRGWFCPPSQLFRAENLSQATLDAVEHVELNAIPLEIRDTFDAYAGAWVQLDEPTFRVLPAALREELLATRDAEGEHGMFRWPSEMEAESDGALIDFLYDGVSPSRHADVDGSTWAECASLLPDARRLAGTFARSSGPNCFATVMVATGMDVENEHMGHRGIEDFLASRTEPVKDPDLAEPGVVLLWRRQRDEPHHACVTLGDGWALNKPAQAWWAPRYVWSLETVLADADLATMSRSAHRLR